MTLRRAGLWLGAGAIAVAVAAAVALHGQDDTADAATLVDVLRVQAGSVVAEIGAGNGSLSVALAKAVGATGRVYTTELGDSALRRLREAIDRRGAGNIEVVEGRESVANLPEDCCDAVFMRNVYHHFGDPASMNASLLRALRPGGRIAVIDFPPRRGGETAEPGERGGGGNHGVAAETVQQELRAAGFEIVSAADRGNRWFLVVAGKPGPR